MGVLQVAGNYKLDKGRAVAIISKPGTADAHVFLVNSPRLTYVPLTNIISGEPFESEEWSHKANVAVTGSRARRPKLDKPPHDAHASPRKKHVLRSPE